MKNYNEILTTILTIEGITLVAEYHYSPAEPRTYDDPGCSAEAEIIKVSTIEDPQDISILLNDWVMQRLEEACLKDVEASRKESKAEALEQQAAEWYVDNMAA